MQSDLREILEEIKRSVRAHMDKDAVLSPTGPTQSFRAGQIDILDRALALLSPASPLVEAALKLADELSDQISRCTDPKRAAELANATDEWGYLLTLNVRYQQARALPVPPQASTGSAPEWPQGNAGESLEAVARALRDLGRPMIQEIRQIADGLEAAGPAQPAPGALPLPRPMTIGVTENTLREALRAIVQRVIMFRYPGPSAASVYVSQEELATIANEALKACGEGVEDPKGEEGGRG